VSNRSRSRSKLLLARSQKLRDEVELLRANERHLNDALQAAEARSTNYQRALESAISDLEHQKRAWARPHAKDALAERHALAQKLNEEVAGVDFSLFSC